jgi:O-antigen ligase
MNLSENISAYRRDDGRLFVAALAALMLMVAGTLLYPETFISVGLRVGPFRISPLAMLFVIAAPPVGWYYWIHRKELRPGLIDIALPLSLVFVSVRGLFAATNANELGLAIAYVCYVLLLYYGTAMLGQNHKAVRAIFYTLGILAIVISTYALLEYLLADNFLYGSLTEEKSPLKSVVYYRSGSTLAQPAVLGIFMVQVIPFLIYLFLVSRNKREKILWGLASALSIAALLVTFAKGSWAIAILMGIGAAIYVVWRWSRFRRALKTSLLILAAFYVAVVMLFTFVSLQNLHFNLLSEERQWESVDMRWIMWKKAPDVFLQHPLVGVGIWQGGNDVLHQVVEEGDLDLINPVPLSNVFIMILVEEGLVGSLLIAATLILAGRHSWLVIKGGGESARIAVPVTVSMMALLINGITADSLLIWPVMVVFWLEAGLIRSQVEIITGKQITVPMDRDSKSTP